MIRISILKFEVRADFVLRVGRGSNDFGQNVTAVRQIWVLTDNLLANCVLRQAIFLFRDSVSWCVKWGQLVLGKADTLLMIDRECVFTLSPCQSAYYSTSSKCCAMPSQGFFWGRGYFVLIDEISSTLEAMLWFSFRVCFSLSQTLTHYWLRH